MTVALMKAQSKPNSSNVKWTESFQQECRHADKSKDNEKHLKNSNWTFIIIDFGKYLYSPVVQNNESS